MVSRPLSMRRAVSMCLLFVGAHSLEGQSVAAITTMQAGVTDNLQYSAADRVNRHASLSGTGVSFPLFVQHTDDPNWRVTEEPPSTNHAEVERIEYLAPDRVRWTAKVHCEANKTVPTKIACWFEHIPVIPGQGTPHDDSAIRFLDWDGRPWQATIELVPDNPNVPGPPFRISPLF